MTYTLHTATGGFRTVIWTDNLQLALLFGGGILIPPVVWYSIGAGPSAWWGVFSQAGRAETPILSADLTVRSTIVAAMLSIFFWEVCTQGADQVAMQRYLATAGDNEARRTIWMYIGGRLRSPGGGAAGGSDVQHEFRNQLNVKHRGDRLPGTVREV